MYREWMKLLQDASRLSLESQQVIALRLLKLARGGPAASREAKRMITEKMVALGEATAKVSSGGSARSVVNGYRKKVRANRRRLTR